MSMSQDYQKYDFNINLSELPIFIQNAIKWSKDLKIIEIKLNGMYYNIIDNLGVLK